MALILLICDEWIGLGHNWRESSNSHLVPLPLFEKVMTIGNVFQHGGIVGSVYVTTRDRIVIPTWLR